MADDEEVNRIFYDLWEPLLRQSVAQSDGANKIKRVCFNYLGYLKQEEMVKKIGQELDLNLFGDHNGDVFLMFVAWASLGVHLLLGSIDIKKLEKRGQIPQKLTDFSNRASERWDVWGGTDDLKDLLVKVGFEKATDKRDLSNLLKAIREKEISRLVRFDARAYVLGILHSKDPTSDPPECSRSAINMIRLFNNQQEIYHQIAIISWSQLGVPFWHDIYHSIALEFLRLEQESRKDYGIGR
jgi:hypothetical protein